LNISLARAKRKSNVLSPVRKKNEKKKDGFFHHPTESL
jgi:hypothetical protein